MPQALLTPQDYVRSAVAVPPIALTQEDAVAVKPNRDLMGHIAAGGVEVMLYGGNANIYHHGEAMFSEALAVLFDNCPDTARILYSIGPDYGKAMDQARVLRDAGVVNAMLLPTAFPSDPRGVAEGVRRIAERVGAPLVLYIKREKYIGPQELAKLIEEEAVGFVKYAVERAEPASDSYLDALLDAVGRDRIASGMGETPIADHVGRRNMATFTSGAVCIAPRAVNELLRLLRSGDLRQVQPLLEPFLVFERARSRFGGISVLHDAVTLSGLADCGPMLPMLSSLDAQQRAEIRPLVDALMAAEDAATARRSAA